MGATEDFAKFIVKTTLADVPKDVIEYSKELSLDCLGCAFVGSLAPTGKIITEFTKEEDGVAEAGVIAGGFRTSATNAAFANGTLSHALDYDDMSFGGHPSGTILPVLLALGEKLKASGKEIMEAHAVGFETFGKLAAACSDLYTRGWHPTPIFGAMGATAAAAKMLKLDVDQTRMALGIAASQVAGAKPNIGTMTKPLHSGHAARCGVVSGILAKKGFTANKEIIEDPLGFCFAHAGQGRYDLEKANQNLGNPLRMSYAAATLKKYPCCGGNHRPLDAALHLIREHNIRYEDVEEVEVGCNSHLLTILVYNEPKTGNEGRFSLHYNMAVAILDGKVDRDTFTDEKVRHPKVQEALKKVKVTVHPEWDVVFQSRRNPVNIRLKNGKEYTHEIDKLKGSPEFRLTREEVVAKYQDCAKGVLSPRQTERSMELMMNLENLKDITELMDIVTIGIRAGA